MSRSLKEYAERDLNDELKRRRLCQSLGLCDFCGRPVGTRPECKRPVRHNVKPPAR